MKILRNYLVNSKNPKKEAYLWNTIASMSNSFQTMLLLLIITRRGNVADASIFTIAFAIANLMLTIGKYGMRNYQVTDVEQKYSYREYCFSRFLTVILMVICSIGYVVYGCRNNNYSSEKAWAIILVCAMRMIEAVEDVFHGRLQQQNRLDIAAKIWGIRTILYILCFGVSYLLGEKLIMSMGISLVVTSLLMLMLNGMVYEWTGSKGSLVLKNVGSLLRDCFPLAISMFLIMYIGNAPKYIIDSVVSDEVQTCFNIIFMPVFVINLLSNFIFNPLLNELAHFWYDDQKKAFWRVLYRQIAIIVGITVFAVIFGKVIGLWLLGKIYAVDLSSYNFMLSLLLISGGLLSLLNLMIVIMTIFRKQQVTCAFFTVSAVLLVLFGRNILVQIGLTGLCLYYIIILVGSNVILIGALKHFSREK